MSAFQEHQEELEHYEQMFGRERGRLAVSLDRLTNALVLVGAARSVLHQPAESRASGDGSANDQPGAGSREGIGAVGDGRDAPGKTKTTKLTIEIMKLEK